MTAYDNEKNNLKSLFGDNKYPTGANFSELIDLPDYRLAENNNGTITVNGITYDMTKTDLESITMVSGNFNALPNGLSFVAFGQTNAPESTSAYWVRTLSSSAYNGRKLQVAKEDITNSCYFRTNSNNTWNAWEAIATQTMLNTKVTDNKDGSITVNGSTFVPADDSKVVHATDGSINFSGINVQFKGTVTGDFHNYNQTGLYSYNTGNGAIANSIGNAPDGVLIVIAQSNGNVYHYLTSSYSERYFEIYMGGGWHSWQKQIFEDGVDNKLATKQDKIGYTPADDSKVAHLSDTNTFNSPQTFSQGIKTLQAGSYDDVNSLVNEGLYFNTNLNIKNGPGTITAGYIQVFSGMWSRIRQIMYSDVDQSLIYTRVSINSGSTWNMWVRIITGSSGSTNNRPTGTSVGYQYFDTDLDEPIWYNGSNWVSAYGYNV